MSKMFKNILAIALVVAMIVPGLSALANDNRHVFPEHFFPGGGYVDGDGFRWEQDYGSITIVRSAGPYAEEVTTPPHQLIPGVPIRIERVQLVDGAVPTAANLQNEQWVRDNTISVNPADVHYGVTDANGEIAFEGLDLGIWLVRELPTLTVTAGMVENGVNLPAVGTVVTNPVNATAANIGVDADENPIPVRFQDFLVALPLYTGTVDEPGTWNFHVRVYPKSEFPTYDNTKQLTDIIGNLATWTLTHPIPNAVENLPHFGVVDVMSENLTFVEDSVVFRFQTGAEPTTWMYLTYPTHFTVEELTNENGVDIQTTEAGRELMGEYGLAGGDVEVTLQSTVDAPGRHSNVARWNVGIPGGGGDDLCPPTDPDCEDELPCPVGEICDWDWFYAFNLEVLKINEADQALAGAAFGLYRELTTAEAALTRTASTDVDGRYYVTVGTNIIYVYNAGTAAAPIWATPLLDADGNHITDITLANGIADFDGIAIASGSGDGTEPLLGIHNLFLREQEAPAGYRIIDEWMPLIISVAMMRPGTGAGDDYEPTWIIDVEVLNIPESNWILPDTGGMGTIVLTVVGLALVGGALVLFLGGKKDEEAA